MRPRLRYAEKTGHLNLVIEPTLTVCFSKSSVMCHCPHEGGRDADHSQTAAMPNPRPAA